MNTSAIISSLGLFVILNVLLSACESFTDIDPPKNELIGPTVFESDATATSSMVGIYSRMVANIGFVSGNTTSLTLLGGLLSDEFANYSTNENQLQFFNNALTPTNSGVASYFWNTAYEYVFTANAILEGLEKSGISPALKSQLMGEAKFVRAFCYFYLVNLFGEVPIVNSTDYLHNASLARSPVEEVYNMVIADLKDAKTLLQDEYPTSERVRPNRQTASALLSRTYLYNELWGDAEQEATDIIDNGKYVLAQVNNVFAKESGETIWQIMPVQPSLNTWEGFTFILLGSPSSVALRPEFMNATEEDDVRKYVWIDSIVVGGSIFYFPLKYKVKSSTVKTEYSVVFRLAEQYLIRAEARAKQGKLPEAIKDINLLRTRAGLSPLNPADPSMEQDALLTIIEKERRIELFAEWGHRWLDLKRTNRAGELLSPIKPGWQDTDQLFPIPQKDIGSNPNLLPQNPGY